jgi:hypothetical protein
LVIPEDFEPLKVTIKATLRSDPSVTIDRIIWVKQTTDPPLPTKEEILNPTKKKKKSDKG